MQKSDADNPRERQLPSDPAELVEYYKNQIAHEKAGKRKLFHSLVKIANELREHRDLYSTSTNNTAKQRWYEGGMWRSPELLRAVSDPQAAASSVDCNAYSWTDLFFSVVIVTAFTRVGAAVSHAGAMDASSMLYFAMIWAVWTKETSYATRFDTTDLSAQLETLTACFAVLFASLSAQSSLYSADGSRIMIMAAAVSCLHVLLHVRVAVSAVTMQSDNDIGTQLQRNVRNYAVFNIAMNLLEAGVWCVGVFVYPPEYKYRWLIFTVGVILSLRLPRAFLANDFHAACSKRGVLFILLLGLLLQSIVVVASEFFTYQTPSMQDYCFLGAACLMLFCIKLLYVEDSHIFMDDHALLVNPCAGFLFHIGHFCLLLGTTVMGSGLNLLTHSYLAATAALPGPAKNLVCGGYSAVLLSTFFIKSMHIKRVPTAGRSRTLFIGAYAIQTLALFTVAITTGIMCYRSNLGGVLEYLMMNDIQLLFALSGSALLVTVLSWLDEGVELAIYDSAEDSRQFRVHPFGFWCCLQSNVSPATDDTNEGMVAASESGTAHHSVLSPLLSNSVANMRYDDDHVDRANDGKV